MTKTKKTSKKPAPKASCESITVPALIAEIADKAKITKTQAKAAYNALLAIVYAGVKQTGGVTLPGLVMFRIGTRAARIGHNPSTGEKFRIPAHKVVKTHALKVFNDSVIKN